MDELWQVLGALNRRPEPPKTWWVVQNFAQIHTKWWLACGEGRMGRFYTLEWRKFSRFWAWRPRVWWTMRRKNEKSREEREKERCRGGGLRQRRRRKEGQAKLLKCPSFPSFFFQIPSYSIFGTTSLIRISNSKPNRQNNLPLVIHSQTYRCSI